MGNDIYRWEDGGGTVHHCPICQTPLTHANARSRCLGEHVEWCPRYHTQLFRIGWSSECTPCKHSDAEHHKRHREIAELLHQLKELATDGSTKSAKHADLQVFKCSTTPSPLSKKERKAAKKAARLSEMPKVVSTSDIEFVARTLHPHAFERDEAEEEKKLLGDPEIKLNLYFHKGTSNTRETRRCLIVDVRGDKHERTVDDAELEAVMQALGVIGGSCKSAEQVKVAAAVRRAVKNDLIEVAKEAKATMERKAGFWRWASTKAYKRLVQNGRIWGQKDDFITAPLKRQDENAAPGRKDSATGVEEPQEDNAGGGVSSAVADEDQDDVLAGAQSASPITDGTESAKSKIAPVSDNGWTQVGRLTRQKKTLGTIKLSLNGGMTKFGQKAVANLGKMNVLSLQDPKEEDDDTLDDFFD